MTFNNLFKPKGDYNLVRCGRDNDGGYLVSKKTIEELDRPNIRINHGKTVYVSRKYKRFVTGMVLTNDGKISIDRNRKRELRARFIALY